MQYFLFAFAVLAAALSGTSPTPAQAQQDPAADGATPEVFAAENAILDTSILFADGASEAQQDLRSAFGWPTFQEGMVEGIYFRIDPDGYARFSPAPRLDTDVFEITCQPRTVACTGRKDRLALYLDGNGLIGILIDGIAPGDSFQISDGIAESPLSGSVLQPLDAPLEAQLSLGSELIVRRGAEVTSRISLRGFGPVTSYLRWLAARQDYAALPDNWPVPEKMTGTLPVVTAAVTGQPTADSAALLTVTPPSMGPAAPSVADSGSGFEISETQFIDIIVRLQRLEQQATAQASPAAPMPVAADRLTYLTTVLGFDLDTAILIARMPGNPEASTAAAGGHVTEMVALPEILPDADQSLAVSPADLPATDFVPLSEYLGTVASFAP